jgi:hypothetical protein
MKRGQMTIFEGEELLSDVRKEGRSPFLRERDYFLTS